MKTLIIYTSYHHNNTEKIAKVMAKELKAEIKKTEEAEIKNLEKYDLVGFGSGIYMWKHHKNLLELVDKIIEVKDPVLIKDRVLTTNSPCLPKAFIFSTRGAKELGDVHKTLREKLIAKGFKIIGEFSCLGWDSFGPLKLIGGINKGRPNEKDLAKAKQFARELKYQ